MALLLLLPLAASLVPQPMRRRAVLSAPPLVAAGLLSPLAFGCGCGCGGLIHPPSALAISATTMTGKTRPDLGVVLVDQVSQQGQTLSADLVVAGGLICSVAFDSKWKLAEGGYYDVEANTRDGEAAFLQRVALPKGSTLDSLPAKWFTSAVLGVDGRYGAYGAPVDGKVIADVTSSGKRLVDISFTSLSPGGAESARKPRCQPAPERAMCRLPCCFTVAHAFAPDIARPSSPDAPSPSRLVCEHQSRKAVVSAVQPAGSTDALLLVAGASAMWQRQSGRTPRRTLPWACPQARPRRGGKSLAPRRTRGPPRSPCASSARARRRWRRRCSLSPKPLGTRVQVAFGINLASTSPRRRPPTTASARRRGRAV